MALLAGRLRAADAPGLPANGGFEAVDAAGAPAAWTLTDRISAVVAEGVAEGRRALRIADGGAEVGSDVRSEHFAGVGGGQVSLVLRTFLESGEADGLGLYLRFWDAAGKELAEARESQIARPVMTAGAWGEATAS